MTLQMKQCTWIEKCYISTPILTKKQDKPLENLLVIVVVQEPF